MLARVVGLLTICAVALAADPFDPVATSKRLLEVLQTQSLVDVEDGDAVIGNTVSQRGFTIFLDDLDPLKLHFTQADVAALSEKWSAECDDQLIAGSLEAARAIATLFSTRAAERLTLIETLTQTPPDFTAPDTYIADAKLRQYAATLQEVHEAWRVRIKYEWLKHKRAGVAPAEIAGKILKHYQRVNTELNRRLKNDQRLYEWFTSALLKGLDPHSSYFSPAAAEDFRIHVTGNFVGIGAKLRNEDGQVIVEQVMPGGSAEASGLIKKKDVIQGLYDSKNEKWVDVGAMPLEETIQFIRGKAGTTVKLRVHTPGDDAPREIELTRQTVKLQEDMATAKLHSVDAGGNRSVKVGVVRVPSFYHDFQTRQGVAEDVEKHLASLKADGVEVLLVDLRLNGGGSLEQAIRLTGLFIDNGPVVQVKDPRGGKQAYTDLPGLAWEGPLAVLVDKHSASASEIFAGAIKSYRRGLVIGDESTHGKGTVQSLIELERKIAGFRLPGAQPSGMVKLTIQQFYLPDGPSTQEIGVTPHVLLPSKFAGINPGESALPHHLKADTVEAAHGFAAVDGFWKDEFAEPLRVASQTRTKASPDFQRHLQLHRLIASNNRLQHIPLAEAEYERLLEKAARVDKELSAMEAGEAVEAQKDAHLLEALEITRDYQALLQGK